MRPVHAGLLGCDTLYLLDEAHTSRPFLDTLLAVSGMGREWNGGGGGGDGGAAPGVPIQHMFMGATLGIDGERPPGSGEVFPPSSADADRLLRGDAALSKRLGAHKHARLATAPAGGGVADAIAGEAYGLAYPQNGHGISDGGTAPAPPPPPPRRIGVVVNRVALARQIHGLLVERIGERDDADGAEKAHVYLLTGRARPIDRDRLLCDEHGRRMFASTAPSVSSASRRRGGNGSGEGGGKGDGTRVFYVATQCVEVGVDADFDALVTQIAPIDSLRQRFGRLDRLGTRSRSDAVIVAGRDEIAKKHVDPIYGDRLPRAWAYLKGVAKKNVVDFGVFHFPARGEGWNDATSPDARSAALMPGYVRMWSQTLPRPDPDPDTAVFLHGVGSGSSADVQVLWRHDVTQDMLRKGGGSSGTGVDIAAAGLAVCRPSQLEAVSVPAWIVRLWLGRRGSYPFGDIEGGSGADTDYGSNGDAGPVDADAEDEDEDDNGGGGGRGGAGAPCALLWRDPKLDGTRPITAGEIRPGQTIIVPTDRGGCDMFGWNERYAGVVRDFGMEAELLHRNVLTFRLGSPYLEKTCPGAQNALERLAADLVDEGTHEILGAIAGIDGIPAAWQAALGLLLCDSGSNEGSGRNPHKAAAVSATAVRSPAGGGGGGGSGSGRTTLSGIRVRLSPGMAARILEAIDLDMAAAAGTATLGKCATGHDGDGHVGGRKGAAEKEKHPPSSQRTRPSRRPRLPLSLEEHSIGTARNADDFCRRIGLDDRLRRDIVLAAGLHDAGKAERRVQALLRGVDPDCLPDKIGNPIAKSRWGRDSAAGLGYAEYNRLLQLARLPRGYRHECWSVRLAETHPKLRDAYDGDLVLYAIGVHHGHGRPMFPPVVDRFAAAAPIEWTYDGGHMSASVDHGLERIGSGWVDMCARLYDRYGPWRLAHIEAIVRLADHNQSRAEEGEEEEEWTEMEDGNDGGVGSGVGSGVGGSSRGAKGGRKKKEAEAGGNGTR